MDSITRCVSFPVSARLSLKPQTVPAVGRCSCTQHRRRLIRKERPDPLLQVSRVYKHAVGYFLIRYFVASEVGYRHEPFMHCPTGDVHARGKCWCDQNHNFGRPIRGMCLSLALLIPRPKITNGIRASKNSKLHNFPSYLCFRYSLPHCTINAIHELHFSTRPA